MTLFEFAVTYAVCWWLVLFMVLPGQAQAPAKPGPGHAPSAPENPRLGKKMRWTTLLAFIPAVALYFIITAAQGHAETVYHAGSDCKPLETYKPGADVTARDGFGAGDKKVTAATMDGQNFFGDKDTFDIPLNIPSADYNRSGNTTADLSESFVNVGKLSVSQDGKTTLNGKSIDAQATYPEGCTGNTKKPSEEDMLKTK